jgi:hypothetical protein
MTTTHSEPKCAVKVRGPKCAVENTEVRGNRALSHPADQPQRDMSKNPGSSENATTSTNKSARYPQTRPRTSATCTTTCTNTPNTLWKTRKVQKCAVDRALSPEPNHTTPDQHQPTNSGRDSKVRGYNPYYVGGWRTWKCAPTPTTKRDQPESRWKKMEPTPHIQIDDALTIANGTEWLNLDGTWTSPDPHNPNKTWVTFTGTNIYDEDAYCGAHLDRAQAAQLHADLGAWLFATQDDTVRQVTPTEPLAQLVDAYRRTVAADPTVRVL